MFSFVVALLALEMASPAQGLPSVERIHLNSAKLTSQGARVAAATALKRGDCKPFAIKGYSLMVPGTYDPNVIDKRGARVIVDAKEYAPTREEQEYRELALNYAEIYNKMLFKSRLCRLR
jgi:hypothetical protein